MAQTPRTGGKSTAQSREAWVRAIKTTKLLNKLESHVLGRVKLSATQLGAARTLLAKTLPDLKIMELTADPAAPPEFHMHIHGKSKG